MSYWDDENEQVFQPMELLAWITLLILVVVLTWPNVAALNIIQKLQGRRTLIKLASYILAGTTFVNKRRNVCSCSIGQHLLDCIGDYSLQNC